MKNDDRSTNRSSSTTFTSTTNDQWRVTGDQEDAIGFVSPTAVSGSSDLNKVDIYYKYKSISKYYIVIYFQYYWVVDSHTGGQ